MPHHIDNYEFGPYRLDSNKRILTCDGETISLTPKAIDILIRLVTSAGQLVGKDELLREIWPDTFVEESNLTQNIFRLRRVLGDDKAAPKYIETVTKRGYKFLAPVKRTRILHDSLSTQGGSVANPSDTSSDGRLVIAILPFNLSHKQMDLNHLAIDISDSIINKLSRVPQVRVMSRTAVLRYKSTLADPRKVGKELGANAILIGGITGTTTNFSINVELVDSMTGWQLWGESFNSNDADPIEIRDTIIRRLIATLKLNAKYEKEKSAISRFTENSKAYQSYLKGRHDWVTFTKAGISKAIKHFKQAIELDPHYALAYVGIIDCYLRLSTDYFPAEETAYSLTAETSNHRKFGGTDDHKVNLRFQWDWKTAERELRRAGDLQTSYPSAHQWYAAYSAIRRMCENNLLLYPSGLSIAHVRTGVDTIPQEFASLDLTLNERVQVYCAISRDQIDAGNYLAASRVLEPWWSFGSWPALESLNQTWCADLLFTCGELAGCVASTLQIPQGQRHGEELLNGSIALFEQLGFRRRVAEARIELALCYYRQGLFDMGRSALLRTLQEIATEDSDLRSLALIRLAILERDAGRLQDALARLTEAEKIMDRSGPWVVCRCHIEMASTYKDLAISENDKSHFDTAKAFYLKALLEFEAVGNHRYVGIVENNLGFLLLSMGSYQESNSHLLRARMLFEGLHDTVRTAQVNETLARLYLATKQLDLAQDVINRAVEILKLTDADALLAEALTTDGIVKSKLNHYTQAKKSFEAAHRIAERCGDRERAGSAVLAMVEEIADCLDVAERLQTASQLVNLISETQRTTLRTRGEKALMSLRLNHKGPATVSNS